MNETDKYKCVNCGYGAAALYKTYAPTVLKLTKCKKCKNIVDKYIEYDPVIVMIDLILMYKEAVRHILYNTKFKSFWKLTVILIMLETCGVWRNESLYVIAVDTFCGFESNWTNLSIIPVHNISRAIPDYLKYGCWAWNYEGKHEQVNELFIWEKDFYVQFWSIVSGIVMFIATANFLMTMAAPFSTREIEKVPFKRACKAFTLAHVSILFTLPMLVWGSDTSVDTRTIHFLLVYAYSFVVFLNVFTVIYECHILITLLILIISSISKYIATFYITSVLRVVLQI